MADDHAHVLAQIHRHLRQGEYAEVEALIGAELRKNPFDALLTDVLGVAARGKGDTAKAIEHFTNAVSLEPANALFRSHLAIVLRAEGHFADARATVEQAIALEPGNAEAHTVRAEILLAQGDFAEGFKEFEWRVHRAGYQPKRAYKSPRWTGGAMAGKTLLVHWEQGDGDVIQFCRFIPLVRELFEATPLHAGAGLVFDCPKRLIPLMLNLGGYDAIGDFGAKPPRHHAHVPLMSLPWVLGTTAATIPNRVPYLSAPHAGAGSSSGDLTVGVSFPSGGEPAPLFDVPGMRFVPVDLDATEIAALDLVVATDGPVVHLAGALAKPTWVMLARVPDWRWGLDGSAIAWYPSLRLFRQGGAGAWDGVVREVARALADFRPS